MGSDDLYRRVINWDEIANEVDLPGVVRKSYAMKTVTIVKNVLEQDLVMGSQTHPFDQLMHVQQGRCDVFVEGERHPMGPGDLLLVAAEAEHSVVMTAKPFVTLLVNIDKP